MFFDNQFIIVCEIMWNWRPFPSHPQMHFIGSCRSHCHRFGKYNCYLLSLVWHLAKLFSHLLEAPENIKVLIFYNLFSPIKIIIQTYFVKYYFHLQHSSSHYYFLSHTQDHRKEFTFAFGYPLRKTVNLFNLFLKSDRLPNQNFQSCYLKQ